ncbi:MAG: hypothetical protein MZU97_13250 [Bacillus subtilis]|nr:hypothetical protein [Bacillus subtilis]
MGIRHVRRQPVPPHLERQGHLLFGKHRVDPSAVLVRETGRGHQRAGRTDFIRILDSLPSAVAIVATGNATILYSNVVFTDLPLRREQTVGGVRGEAYVRSILAVGTDDPRGQGNLSEGRRPLVHREPVARRLRRRPRRRTGDLDRHHGQQEEPGDDFLR